MTEPHLQGIDIIQNTIIINCELYSPELDEYLSCEGGVIYDKKLIKKFKKLDLNKKKNVLEFISAIENCINWDEVNEKLYDEVEKEKENKIVENEMIDRILPKEKINEELSL